MTNPTSVQPPIEPVAGPLAPRKPDGRTLRRVLLLSAVIVLVGWAGCRPALRAAGAYLVIEDRPAVAEVVVVLTGGEDSRPLRASHLYHRGLAPTVLVVETSTPPTVLAGVYPRSSDATVTMLRRYGVPDSAITILHSAVGAASTFDEATAVRDYVEREGIRSLLLVTSRFHTRRARWAFTRALRGMNVELRMAAALEWGFDEHNWWRSEEGLVTVTNEHLKLAFYIAQY